MEFVLAMVGMFIFGAALRRMQRPTLQRVPVVLRRRVRRQEQGQGKRAHGRHVVLNLIMCADTYIGIF